MQEKIQFNQIDVDISSMDFQEKKEFEQNGVDIEIDNHPLEEQLLENQFNRSMQAGFGWGAKLMMAIVLLFLVASIAQSLQWLIDTWLAKQWIYFAFALVGFGLVMLGLSVLFKELWRLRYLRQHMLCQQKSRQFIGENSQSAVQMAAVLTADQTTQFCTEIAKNRGVDEQGVDFIRWKKQLNPTHSAQEIALLFSYNVLQSIDKKAKKIVIKTAVESAALVAVSPLAIVDMFFVAWRNIRLINQIAQLYGMELGYFSRLQLMKWVLVNMAFTGVVELIQDMGMDWLSQDLTAKLSARAAQGIGVGILSARLGIKAIEFCRPMVFQRNERVRLSHIQQELLGQMKTMLLNQFKPRSKV
ncbi:MAG: TIGR01620 family protein [Lonepinella koalarum]|nr:TIGR01620 family protein [Lonepinella koalarum]